MVFTFENFEWWRCDLVQKNENFPSYFYTDIELKKYPNKIIKNLWSGVGRRSDRLFSTFFRLLKCFEQSFRSDWGSVRVESVGMKFLSGCFEVQTQLLHYPVPQLNHQKKCKIITPSEQWTSIHQHFVVSIFEIIYNPSMKIILKFNTSSHFDDISSHFDVISPSMYFFHPQTINILIWFHFTQKTWFLRTDVKIFSILFLFYLYP